jgi:holo-[acyl-carrier protein] synthase
MIVGLGIDLVTVDRFVETTVGEAFLRKIFTPAEISSCQAVKNSAERFAGKFAAKEAFMKAIGHGIRQEVWFAQIEVLNHETGEPYIQVYREAQLLLQECGAERVLVSISHTRDLAVAVVILEKE